MRKRPFTSLALALPIMVIGSLAAVPAQAAAGPEHPDLAGLVTVKELRRHLTALDEIARDNGGNRAAGSPGYDASVRYVVDVLKKAGYRPRIHDFEYDHYDQLGPTLFEQAAPTPTAYAEADDGDYLTLEYSGLGDVTAPAAAVDVGAPSGVGSGCEPADFTGFPSGSIAIVQRGGCTFAVKVANAEAAGAAGAVIFQHPDAAGEGPVAGTLGGPARIPVVGPTHALGSALAARARAGGLTLHIRTDVFHERRTSQNVIADTGLGDPSRKVVVGAHLDSVDEGPGINDNGSGSAALLAMARHIGELGEKGVRHQVRFAWWGAEELGLIGSNAYVASLSEQELSTIALNLNFDMLGSPNFARFVYDGDNSLGDPTVPPPGSAEIERAFETYFAERDLATEPTPFSGRSDYFAFIEKGIPAGGLFSGAEGVKTAAQVALYGGTAGVAYDKCYHQACDDLTNINWTGLDQLADGAAHVTQRFAHSLTGIPATVPKTGRRAADTIDRRGDTLIR